MRWGAALTVQAECVEGVSGSPWLADTLGSRQPYQGDPPWSCPTCSCSATPTVRIRPSALAFGPGCVVVVAQTWGGLAKAMASRHRHYLVPTGAPGLIGACVASVCMQGVVLIRGAELAPTAQAECVGIGAGHCGWGAQTTGGTRCIRHWGHATSCTHLANSRHSTPGLPAIRPT